MNPIVGSTTERKDEGSPGAAQNSLPGSVGPLTWWTGSTPAVAEDLPIAGNAKLPPIVAEVGGQLACILNAVKNRRTYSKPRMFSESLADRSIVYAKSVVERWKSSGISFAGKNVLELGPGPDLLVGAILITHEGAASYTAVDRFELVATSNPSFDRFVASTSMSAAEVRSKIDYLVGDPSQGFSPRYAADVVVSSACLEHVPNVELLFSAVRAVSAPGARHAHIVDPKAHMAWFNHKDPWNALRVWKYYSFPGSLNCIPASSYVRILERQGMTVALFPHQKCNDAYLDRLRIRTNHRAAWSRSDLELAMFYLLATDAKGSSYEGTAAPTIVASRRSARLSK